MQDFKKDQEKKERCEEEILEKQKIRPRGGWILSGIAVCLAAALLFTSLYDSFHSRVEEQQEELFQSENMVALLFQDTYVLYRDLYNRIQGTQADYRELYLSESVNAVFETIEKEQDSAYYGTGPTLNEDGDIDGRYDYDTYHWLYENYKWMMQEITSGSDRVGRLFDYVIRDNNSEAYVTNMSEEELNGLGQGNDYFAVTFVFDSAGNAYVGEYVKGRDTDALRRTANQVCKNTLLLRCDMSSVMSGPSDCTVTYVISQKSRDSKSAIIPEVHNSENTYDLGGKVFQASWYYPSFYPTDLKRLYLDAGVTEYLLCVFLAVFVLGIFLPLGKGKPWLEKGSCKKSLEFLVCLGVLLFACIALALDLVTAVASRTAAEELGNWIGRPYVAGLLVLAGNVVLLGILFFGCWYLGICARALKEMGLKGYLRERSLICRFFPYMKGKAIRIYHGFLHIDLTKNSKKTLRRLVIANAVILAVISLLWLGGLGIVVVYSAVLYLILRKYVSDLQKRYGILLKAVDEMAEGNLNVEITEDLGIFEPFKPQVIKIQNGFRKAVDEEVKSQRMKAELITNVSHDLKTPLTAIITYVNLLKDPNLTEEQRKEYLDIMEQKSMRLKALIEDLFEVSKATTGNITLNLVPVDILNLVKQVSFEMQDKFAGARLDVRLNLGEEKIVLSLDSQKTYRIYENLFSNVAKYALEGTRVYVTGAKINDSVVITIKNISAQELTVDASELTERFVRGDLSRNTEGSGLGLAIAKSFTELQGGQLKLEVDGDLFKVTTVWQL